MSDNVINFPYKIKKTEKPIKAVCEMVANSFEDVVIIGVTKDKHIQESSNSFVPNRAPNTNQSPKHFTKPQNIRQGLNILTQIAIDIDHRFKRYYKWYQLHCHYED